MLDGLCWSRMDLRRAKSLSARARTDPLSPLESGSSESWSQLGSSFAFEVRRALAALSVSNMITLMREGSPGGS